MIKALYSIATKAKAKNLPGWQYLYKMNKGILNVCYPMLHKHDQKSGIDENGKLIVSLTTFPDRVDDVWISITSIMNQTVKAKKIILWLSRVQFPVGRHLPDSLKRLEKRGLEIRFCEEDLMPHKKYFYTMQEYPEDIVVTIDDDIFYPENHLEMLWKKHEAYPDAVVCWYAGKIQFDQNGKFLKYNDWESDVPGEEEPSMLLIPIGCGGVLYPPKSLCEDVFDIQQIKKLCIKTDDLWLKVMEVKKGTKAVRCVKNSNIFFGLIKTRHKGLFKENADSDGNDQALRNILSEYTDIEAMIYQNSKS